ncbi:MAG: N-acetylmuramoyl-L-alanine amidase [Bacteroidales bacterium]
MGKHYLLFILLYCCLVFPASEVSAKTFTIVLDPGHGGKDPGCIGAGGTKEKTVNLAVALKLGQLIEANHKDVKVVYTRKTDIFVPLIQRTEIANKHKADLFISIHADAVPAKNAASAYGTGTFTLGTAKTDENLEVAKRENAVILLEDDYQTRYQGFDPNSAESYIMFETLQGTHQTQSIQLASLIQTEFRTRAKRHDRQVRQAPYLVLKTASMPAVLVETGFLSNRNEEKYLASAEGRNKISAAIYHGFNSYKEAYDRHNGVTAVAQPAYRETETPKSTPKSNTSTNTNKQQTDRKITETKSAKSNPKGKIEYRVQFLSYHKKLTKGAPQLKGLWPVDYYVEKGTYRFTYGSTTDFNEITRIQRQVRGKFKDAFVIRFQDGKRIAR